jgi:hypothetical protein
MIPFTTLLTGSRSDGVRPVVSASATSEGATTAVTGLVGLPTGYVAGSTKGIGCMDMPPNCAVPFRTPIPVVLVVLLPITLSSLLLSVVF